MATIIEFPFFDRVINSTTEDAVRDSLTSLTDELRVITAKFNERITFDIIIVGMQDGTHVIARPVKREND